MDTGFADTTLLFSQTWYGHPYKQEGIKKMKKLLRGREEQKQQAHQSRYLDFFSIWIISVNFRCFLTKCIDKIKKSLVVSFFIPTFAK